MFGYIPPEYTFRYSSRILLAYFIFQDLLQRLIF